MDKLIVEYTALAARYDRRWSAYMGASLRLTMSQIPTSAADHVLDVACGTGRLLQMLATRRAYQNLVGIDKVPAMLEIAGQRLGKRVTLLEADAENLPLEDGKFGLVLCTNALHYFMDATASLREIRRVIHPSGHLVITDWCRDYYWMRLLNRSLPLTRHAHTHTFDTAELRQIIHDSGFKVISISKRKIDWFWGLMSVHAIPI